MGGIQRFERRYSWWIKLRDRMHWIAYDSQRAGRIATLAKVGLLAVLFVLLSIASLTILAVALSSTSHAATSTDAIPRQATQHRLQLRREAQRIWGLDAPVATFAAQIHQESRWRADAASPVGAQGLAQFMPSTARWIAGMHPAGSNSLAGADSLNPSWSIRALVTYDRWLRDRLAADDDCERMAYVLSAYNGGLGWVYKRQARSKTPGKCLDATCSINPGVTLASQRENEHYPRVILQRYEPLYATWGPRSCT